MNRQWIIRAAVSVALAAFVGWIASNTRWEEVTVPALPGGEAAQNPFYAAQRLTEELGATSEWHRTLGELPRTDAVLMLTYWHWGLIDRRRVRLEQWVESGGRLVILGNLMGGAGALQEWSGLAKEYPESAGGDAEEADAAEYEPQAGLPPFVSRTIRPCLTLRLAAGPTNSSLRHYDVCGLDGGRLTSSQDPEWALAEMRMAADDEQEQEDWLQAVRVAAGRGSVTWINADSYGQTQPFGNRPLLLEDHGVLFADVVQLHRDDHVVFVSEDESASLLELVWTYGAPVVVLSLLLIGLAVWRDAARFGPLAATLDGSRRSLAEQIRGTAQFALRVGGGQGLHAAMVRALHEAACLRIPGYERLSERDRIPAIGRLTGLDVEKLSEAIHPIPHQNAHDLREPVALLDAARRNLIASLTDDRRRARRAKKSTAREAFDPVRL